MASINLSVPGEPPRRIVVKVQGCTVSARIRPARQSFTRQTVSLAALEPKTVCDLLTPAQEADLA